MNDTTALQKNPNKHSYTYFVSEGLYSCNDCGATARTKELVEHYETCTPGESDHWVQYYNEEEEGVLQEEEEDDGFFG